MHIDGLKGDTLSARPAINIMRIKQIKYKTTKCYKNNILNILYNNSVFYRYSKGNSFIYRLYNCIIYTSESTV